MSAPMKMFSIIPLRADLEYFLHLSRRMSCFACLKLQRDGPKRNLDCHHTHFSILSRCNTAIRIGRNNLIRGQLFENTCYGLQTRYVKDNSVPLYQNRCKALPNTQNCLQDDSLKKKEKENIYTIPNLLTISRIILTPAIGYCVIQDSYSIALGLFTYAGLSDLLDGYIARNFKNQMSAFGTALDPLADKLLITVLTVTLTISNLLPAPLAVLIIGRDVLLVITGFMIRYVSLPPPKTLKRYFDVTYPTAKLIPSKLSKWNTANQILLVMLTLAAPVFEFVDHPVFQGLWYLTAATTFGSGIDYIINWKSSVKYLKL